MKRKAHSGERTRLAATTLVLFFSSAPSLESLWSAGAPTRAREVRALPKPNWCRVQ